MSLSIDLSLLLAGLGVILITTWMVFNIDENFKQLSSTKEVKSAIDKTSKATLHGLDQMSPDPLDLLWEKYGTIYSVGFVSTFMGAFVLVAGRN